MKRVVQVLLAALLIASGTLAGSAVALAQQARAECDDDWVQVFSNTGQDPKAWIARIAGEDLYQLVNDNSGWAFISITDDDGTESFERRWDNRGAPLSVSVTLNGLHPSIYVAIQNSTKRYTGCSSTYHLTYRAT